MWTTQYRMLRVGLSIFSFQAIVPFVCVFYVYCRLGIRAYSLYLLLCTWCVYSPIYLSADPTVLVAACPGGCEAFSSFCYTLFQVSNEQNPLPSTHFKETDSRHPSMPSRDKKMAESPVTTVRGPCVDLAYAPQPNNQARTPPHKRHPTFVAPPPAQWWLVNATRQTRQENRFTTPPRPKPKATSAADAEGAATTAIFACQNTGAVAETPVTPAQRKTGLGTSTAGVLVSITSSTIPYLTASTGVMKKSRSVSVSILSIGCPV